MLIELIREGRVEEAVVYAQDHLAERGQRDPSILNELERTLALLAFDQPDTSPFGDLLHPSHRQKVRAMREVCDRNITEETCLGIGCAHT